MGSVVEMRFLRGAILTIVAILGLVAGVASTAYADDDPGAATPTSALGGWSPTSADPGDPGLPPD